MTTQTITITQPLGPGDSLTINVAPVVPPVNPPITDLQAALNAVKPGGTLDAVGQAFTGTHYLIPAGVTLANAKLTYAGAAGAAQSGYVDLSAGSKLSGVTVVGGPYAAVRVWVGATNAALIGCDISKGPALGVIGYECDGLHITGGRVYDNNTGAGTGNEEGGVKLGNAANVVITAEVDHNVGPGIWADVNCSAWTIDHCRLHDNTGPGVKYEISQGGSITNNDVWECGWADGASAFWGAGLQVSSSGTTTLSGNTVAWCPQGIDFVSQNRSVSTGGDTATGNLFALSGTRKQVTFNEDWADPSAKPTMSPNGTATPAQLIAAGISPAPLPGH